MKLINNKTTRFIRWFLIPFLLFLLWVGLSINYINDQSGLTVLVKNHNKNSFLHFTTNELHKGQKINASFTASENNLGIVAVRFNTFNRINDDEVVFSIKEHLRDKWFYEGRYNVDQFQPNKLFTFGFPAVGDSANRTYDFQIESLKGSNLDSVAISQEEPVIVTKYQIERHLIISSIRNMSDFLFKKIMNSLSDIGFIISTVLYLLPFLLYTIWLLFFDKYLAHRYYLVLLPLLLLILAGIILTEISQLLMVVGVLSWTFIVVAYKLEGKLSFVFSLVYLFFVIIAISFNLPSIAQNMSLWAYLLLVIGTIQQILELKFGNKNKISYMTFLNKLIGHNPLD